MRNSWSKGLTKETNASLLKTSNTMKERGLDNFRAWRDQMKAEGKIKSSYEPLEQCGDLAELIGVVLGDGHIYRHDRCESLRITGDSQKLGFVNYTADLVERIFKRTPTVRKVTASNAMTVTIYEKQISQRLGIPVGSRSQLNYQLPEWISANQEYQIHFLRGLYEAEGTLAFHAGTYTHKFIFSNANEFLLNLVMDLVAGLGYHPHYSYRKIQVSKKAEVQKLADLLQFRSYET